MYINVTHLQHHGYSLSAQVNESVDSIGFVTNTTYPRYLPRSYEKVGGSTVINSIWVIYGAQVICDVGQYGGTWCTHWSMTPLSRPGAGTLYGLKGSPTGESVTSYYIGDYPSDGLQNGKYYLIRE